MLQRDSIDKHTENLQYSVNLVVRWMEKSYEKPVFTIRTKRSLKIPGKFWASQDLWTAFAASHCPLSPQLFLITTIFLMRYLKNQASSCVFPRSGSLSLLSISSKSKQAYAKPEHYIYVIDSIFSQKQSMKNSSLYVEKLRGLQRMKNIYTVDSNYNVPFFLLMVLLLVLLLLFLWNELCPWSLWRDSDLLTRPGEVKQKSYSSFETAYSKVWK